MAEQKFESVMKDFQKSLSVLSNLNQEKEKVLDGRNVQAIRGDMTSNKSVSSWKDAERLVGTYISSWQQAQRDARIAVLNSSTATVARREAEKCNYPRYNVSQLSAGRGYFIDTSSIDAPMTDADESQHFTLAQFEDLARLSATHYPIARAEKVVDSLCINIQRLLDLQGHLIDFSIQLKHFANVLETDIQDQRILQKEECKPMIAGLLQSCGTLIVNSSSLSPFCPLELPSCNQQSACDGLDALIDSAFEIAGKRINHKLKNCVLRARSEQNALLMQLHYFQCLNVSYKTILSSLKKSSKSTNIIEGKKLHLILNELKKFREMLLSIMSAIQQAEDARVKIPLAAFQNQLSNRTLHPNAAPAVNPLDALARGILGEKVAELVFTLRSMRQSLESLPERIEIIEQQLQ